MQKSPTPPLKMVDILALDRTRLANERTLLAYARSAFALLVAGISLIKVFPQDVTIAILGSTFIGLSPFLLGFGIYRSYRFQARWKHYFNISPETLKTQLADIAPEVL
jgi:putative membrane protein